MIETIPLWEAIKEMRKLTAKGETFSFVHSTFNLPRQTSDGIRVVKKAKLRPAAKEDDIVNAEHKLFYFDEEIQKPRNCWQILIMYFNGKKILVS